MTQGTSESCGCLADELTVKRSTTHGMTNSREWETWHRMKRRCSDPNISSYPRYGGRGIRVCQRWLEAFQNFYDDMGKRPSGLYSIERLDSDGHYEPGNCVWATIAEQNCNKSNNVYIEANGETQTCAEWARRLGTNQTTIYSRLRMGWSHERSVTQPVRRKGTQ